MLSVGLQLPYAMGRGVPGKLPAESKSSRMDVFLGSYWIASVLEMNTFDLAAQIGELNSLISA